MAGHVAKEFVASYGVIQGCPLSVLLLNLLISESRDHNSNAKSVCGRRNSRDIDTALRITGHSATVTQQELNETMLSANSNLLGLS